MRPMFSQKITPNNSGISKRMTNNK